MTDDLPKAECLGCSRKVACVRMSDGTTIRPLAWTYPHAATPLMGWCSHCQANLAAVAVLEARGDAWSTTVAAQRAGQAALFGGQR